MNLWKLSLENYFSSREINFILDFVSDAIRLHGLKEIAVDGEIAAVSGNLPPVHQDPCGRIVIATAIVKKFQIVTADTVFREYKNVKVIW